MEENGRQKSVAAAGPPRATHRNREPLARGHRFSRAKGLTPATLARVGSALYGPSWQTPLAEALRVNSRTVRRWKAGGAPIPAAVEADLLAMLRWRRAELGGLADALARDEDAGE